MPVVAHITRASPDEPLLAVVLSLRAEKITALLAETDPAAAARPRPRGAVPAAIAVSDASPALVDAVGRLLTLLMRPATPLPWRQATNARSCGG